MRALFIDPWHHDWPAIIQQLSEDPTLGVAVCETQAAGGLAYRQQFLPTVSYSWQAPERIDVKLTQPADAIGSAAREWATVSDERLWCDGMELLKPLAAHVADLAAAGAAASAHASEFSRRLISSVKPDVVCFTSVGWLPAKRLAHLCRLEGIPVLSYQHGGGFGTHRMPMHDLCDFGESDRFLCYGDGTRFDEAEACPRRATLVPVGSPRLASMVRPRQPKTSTPLTVVWMAEASTQNTFGSAFQVEDILRFELQRECLKVLAASSRVKVVYRPHPYRPDWQGTPDWIRRHAPAVAIREGGSALDVLSTADVVVTDLSSATVWLESLALGKPLILYCDPRQTRLHPEFARDLDAACLWCRTAVDISRAVTMLAQQPLQVLTSLTERDPEPFLRRYATAGLSAPDCVERAAREVLMAMRSRPEGSHPS